MSVHVKPSSNMVDIRSQNDSEYDKKFEQDPGHRCGTGASTPSSLSDYITSDADDSSDGRCAAPFTLRSIETQLVLTRDATPTDLREMVKRCKEMVMESAECSEERKWLVRRLIELRLRAQELREVSVENLLETCVILGHHLAPQKNHAVTYGPIYCDNCSAAVWTMLQSWYMCNDCGFCCHAKCLTATCRVCAHIVASEAGGYTFTKDICPERGLSAQLYRCAECNASITFNKLIHCLFLQAFTKGLFLSCFGSPFKYTEAAWIEPRLCDYTGLYYCQRCHWNTTAPIPARIIRNWDMEPRKVSRAAAQLLEILEQRPVLNLEQLNPKLFTLVPDLSLVKLREELQMIKRYLVFCPNADNEGLPWRAGLRSHMVENSGSYAIKDLIDLQNGTLIEEIRAAHDAMRKHVAENCDLCRARGHLCELCGNDEVIYPWDAGSFSCPECSTVYHRACWAKRNHHCSKCSRIQKRLALNQWQGDGNLQVSTQIDETKDILNLKYTLYCAEGPSVNYIISGQCYVCLVTGEGEGSFRASIT
ncbi:differentially expressed in FDCP 8 homolog isoform X2 [Neodiprion lecontei]|uniref:Differentially expressed in FDCP 8 homolog isoform X2 n=1 Tax=Neodiprion lecontei TaxID=441921 RepID=A0ABM3FH62_NEOLC|nr:differentially expressed in FDCP 8 homolog isoform X2 [Neodiprion lecontei]